MVIAARPARLRRSARALSFNFQLDGAVRFADQAAKILAVREFASIDAIDALVDSQSGKIGRRPSNHAVDGHGLRLGLVGPPRDAEPHGLAGQVERYFQRFVASAAFDSRRDWPCRRQDTDQELRRIGHVGAVKRHDTVSGADARQVRGRTGAHAIDQDPTLGGRLAIDADTQSARRRGQAALPVLLLEPRFGARLAAKSAQAGGVGQFDQHVEHQLRDLLQPLGVDLVGVVAGAMVVVVQTSVQHQHGNVSRIKRPMVAIALHLPTEIEQELRGIVLAGNEASQAGAGPRAIHDAREFRSRPIMSTLNMIGTRLSDTVGSSSQCFEPSNPFSSPSQKANRIDRRGFSGNIVRACATSSNAATPLALSSAPL